MKTAIATSLILLAALALSTSNAQAQTGTYAPPITQGYGGGYPVYGYGWGTSSSTVAESWYRGKADLVRAWGENNYNNSAAQINWEQAREKAIANHTAEVEQYFALRKFNEQQRFGAIAKSRLSKEQLTSVSRKAAPKRLAEDNWNAATDGLAWPKALKNEEFAAASARLDELYRLRRDSSGGMTAEETDETQHLVKAMTEQLKGMISQVKPSDYASAKRFLNSVGHEANFEVATGERLAAK